MHSPKLLIVISCLVLAGPLMVSAADILTIDGSAEVILDSTSVITVSGGITGTGTLTLGSSGNVYVGGNWGISTFAPGSSTVWFNGTSDIISTVNNKSFENLIISGNATISTPSTSGLEINNALTVTEGGVLNLGSNLTHTVLAITTVSGTLNSGLSTLRCNGDLKVSATGIINMNGSSATLRPELRMADTKTIEINGTLNTTWSVSNLKPVITSTVVGARYTFTVNGKISANGLIIASTTNGLNIAASADKTSDLDNIEFQNVANGSRHLYIGFSDGNYVGSYDTCSFDNSFGGGNNVVCAVTSGSTIIYFSKWTGAGCGDQYESEGTNTSIIWIPIDTMVASSPASIVMESNSAITVSGDFNIEVLTCNADASVYLSGVWGVVTFTPGTSTVYFNGGTQTIAMGSGTSNFYNVVVMSSDANTSSGSNVVITSTGSLNVSQHSVSLQGNYTLNGGTITLGNTAGLTVNTNAKLKAINQGSITSSNPGTNRFSFNVTGEIELDGCTITSTTEPGLNIQTGTTIDMLKDVRFYSHPGGSGRFITCALPSLNQEFQGCWFDTITSGYNVSATGAGSILKFDTYNGGDGAGENKDYDADSDDDGVADAPSGGAVVYWVFRSVVDTESIGGIQGFPTAAFDLNTYAYYSTYVVSRDISGNNTTDRVYVLDTNGTMKYYYNLHQQYGDIVFLPWWFTEGTTHTVYFGTTTGYLFRLIDTGSSLTLATDWPLKVCTEITSGVISDGVNLYFGGMEGVNAKIFGWTISPVGILFEIGTATRVSATPSWSVDGGTTYLFIGSDAPTPLLYRVNVYAKVIDMQNDSPTDNVRAPTTYWAWLGTSPPKIGLYAGDYDGQMHGIDPFSSSFTNQTGFPVSYGAYSITAMAYVAYLPYSDAFRIMYADMGGWFYDINFDGGSLYDPPSGPPYPFQPDPVNPSTPIESSPMPDYAGLIYIGNNDGKVFVIDESQRSVTKTYSFGAGIKIGDISSDADTGRLLIPTSIGKVYFLQ